MAGRGDFWTPAQLQAEKDRLVHTYGYHKTALATLELWTLKITDQEDWALCNAAWLAIEEENRQKNP